MSRWKCVAISLVMLHLVFVGCDVSDSSRTSTIEDAGPQGRSAELRAKYPQFRITTESQHAVFSTLPSTGGGGDPVNAGAYGQPVEVHGLPVLLLYEAQELLRNSKLGKLPSHNTKGTILVEARIHLERESVRLSTPDGSRREVYSAVIDKLIHCEWQ